MDNGSEAFSDEEDDYDVHEIVKTGTYLELKEVIAKDRPRLIALKDEVSEYESFVFIFLIDDFLARKNHFASCSVIGPYENRSIFDQ